MNGRILKYGLSYNKLRNGVLNVAVVNPNGARQIVALKNKFDIDVKIILLETPLEVRCSRYLLREKAESITVDERVELLKRMSARLIQDELDFKDLSPLEYTKVFHDDNKTVLLTTTEIKLLSKDLFERGE